MKPATLLLCALCIFGSGHAQMNRKFDVDLERNIFVKDGEEFRYVSGSFHYFRALPETWAEKLHLMRLAGLNAVDVYIQWSLHNPKDGVYTWEGIADIELFIRLATAEGLYIILRPGPYICAEIDNGGLPYWLQTKYPGIQVRTNDENFKREVEIWYSKLMPKFAEDFYGKGGNIIMVQVENEYGAFKKCDKPYLNFLRNETSKYTEDNALLFTTDRPIDNELHCGLIPGVFATTDFGIASEEEVKFNFDKLREVQPNGPLVNSEFYTGWLTHWQEPNARRSAYELANTLRTMLDEPYKANVNFYMFFGGTNFGFWAGANDWGIGKYMADITSYDYDSPLDETGGTTAKYYILRDAIGEYLPLPPVSQPAPSKKTKYPSFKLKFTKSILLEDGRKELATPAKMTGGKLLTFEELDQFSGFVLYEADLPKFTRDPSNLVVNKLHDRAQIYIDGRFVGVLSRENDIYSLPINANFGKRIQILVENQGRINFQDNFDLKGILGNVTVQTFKEPYYEELSDWTITGYPFEDYKKIENFIASHDADQNKPNCKLRDGPAIFYGEFTIASEADLADTWWNTVGWGKGSLFVNEVNLGRYWPLVGPQITMYIPKDLLKHGKNVIEVVELEKAPFNLKLSFVNGPIFINDEKV